MVFDLATDFPPITSGLPQLGAVFLTHQFWIPTTVSANFNSIMSNGQTPSSDFPPLDASSAGPGMRPVTSSESTSAAGHSGRGLWSSNGSTGIDTGAATQRPLE